MASFKLLTLNAGQKRHIMGSGTLGVCVFTKEHSVGQIVGQERGPSHYGVKFPSFEERLYSFLLSLLMRHE